VIFPKDRTAFVRKFLLAEILGPPRGKVVRLGRPRARPPEPPPGPPAEKPKK